MHTYEEIQTVSRYKTPDHEEWSSFDSAKHHIDRINDVLKTDEILDSGGTVAQCLEVLGYVEIDPVFHRLTKDSKLVIEHWQCQSRPGYQVSKFNTKGKVWVFGDAGSWSGPYGNWVSIPDLLRYASDSRSQLSTTP